MSCALGTIVRTADGPCAVENVSQGAWLLGGNDDQPSQMIHPLQRAMLPCVRVRTECGRELVCDRDHVLLGGNVEQIFAAESLRCWVRTFDGGGLVVEVSDVGPVAVVKLGLAAPGVYESNQILSEELAWVT